MGRGEMSGLWGGAREAAPQKRGAVDGVGQKGRSEIGGRWGGAR